MLATIRDLGRCPCPRCLVQLSQVHNMGTIRDMKLRDTKARIDDDGRRRKVDIAREIIYKKNYAVDSEWVEVHLQEQSLVPTLVSGFPMPGSLNLKLYLSSAIERFLSQTFLIWLQFLSHACR